MQKGRAAVVVSGGDNTWRIEENNQIYTFFLRKNDRFLQQNALYARDLELRAKMIAMQLNRVTNRIISVPISTFQYF